MRGNVLSKSTVSDAINDNDGSNRIPDALLQTSSLAYIDKGFLYDTVDMEGVANLGNHLSYYNYNNEWTDTHTLASSYLLQYSYAWEVLAAQKVRLEAALAGGTGMRPTKFNVAKMADDWEYNPSRLIHSEDYLLGLPLDAYSSANDETKSERISGVSELEGLEDETIDNSKSASEAANKDIFKGLSYYYYGLYSESPFYFFNFNVRDQLEAEGYSYNKLSPAKVGTDDGAAMSKLTSLFLEDNQSYFFNLKDSAGEGYGELRDFMNMHDFFYYIMPMMKPSSDLVREFDDKYGMYTYDSCSLRFDSTGRFWYGGSQFDSLDGDNFQNAFADADAQEKYEFWHDWNVYTIMQAYAPWYDAMTDCRYAKPEQIEIGDEKFTVENPLDPTSYFSVDDNGDMTEGRFMVFSRSEMEYYGITWTNLTQVERNIILMQDNVYKEAIHLMNYYNLSDDVLIQAMAMLELFEFNKIFSQTIGTNYTLYPTGYELRAFTYDAYLRLILAEASGEDIATNPTSINGSNDYNRSIYSRIQQNTSILFSLTLIVNDFLAIYVIPVLRIIFLFSIFFTGILVLLAAVFGMEFNFVSVLTKSFLIPLCSFGFATLVLAYITSFLMSDGNSAVVGNDMTINIGDPTIALFVILFINAMVVVVYSKIVIKMFRDIKTLIKTFTNSIVGAVTGAFSNVVGSTLGRFGIAAGTGAGVYAFSNSRNRSGGDSAEGSTTKSRINNRGGIAGTNTKDSKDVTKDPKSQSENTNNAKKNNYNDKSDRFNGKTKVTENNANRVRQNESQNGENSYDSKAKSGNLSDVKTIKARQGEKNPVNEQNNRNNNKQSSNTQNNSNNGKNKNRGQRDPMFGVGYNKTKVDVNRKSKKK